MATDASIYGNIRQPKPVNMLADYANMMQLESAQQQNAMNRMAMGEKVRGIERQNKLASLLEGTPEDQIEPALMRGGFMPEAMAFGENKAKRAKADADARSASLGAKEKEIELVGRTFGFLKDKPTPENASFMMEFLEGQGLMPAPQVQQFKTLFAGNPDKIGLFAEQMFRQALSAKDQLHKTETRDAGGFVQTTATDPVSLKQAVIGQTAKTVSPDAQLSAQTSTANNKRSVGAQYAIADATRAAALTEKQLKIGEMQDKAEERKRQRDAGISSIGAQIGVIDKALAHPGRQTSTGLSGTMDPRNYVPGTDAADFRAVLDQIGGAAFLQAFESLKGGGQITEVEGKKATDAMARLSRAQSDKEFEQSLRELREVMAAGYKRQAGRDFSQPAAGGNLSQFKVLGVEK